MGGSSKRYRPTVAAFPVAAMFGRILFALVLPCAVAQKPPVPPEILKIICDIASSQTIEDDISGAVCNEVKKLFPSIHFDPDCKTIFDELWEVGLGLICNTDDRVAIWEAG